VASTTFADFGGKKLMRYPDTIFGTFQRFVSPRNPSGSSLKFLLSGLSVCKISDKFFKILFGCSLVFYSQNSKTYSGLASRIYILHFITVKPV
jgi:hypothetical protein